MSSKTTKTEAEAKFARSQKRATDAARAMNDAAAEAKRVDDNTARLRALRMARDAKLAADAAVAGPVPAPAKGRAKPKAAVKAPLKAPPKAAKGNPSRVRPPPAPFSYG